jgi:hypothetical protein
MGNTPWTCGCSHSAAGGARALLGSRDTRDTVSRSDCRVSTESFSRLSARRFDMFFFEGPKQKMRRCE